MTGKGWKIEQRGTEVTLQVDGWPDFALNGNSLTVSLPDGFLEDVKRQILERLQRQAEKPRPR